ncbi:hypothetical protein [Methylovorus mays]|uniref:hypothetical protein n=1 Tax=Methylovorus mays TaxID=184077 RepID=UPI001E55D830|nr:hypothetical protein [Methylovorus mays]MCB5207805.1 hypothetical protein [Methylovorus mays]
MDKKILEWVEVAAIENMKSRQQNIDLITAEAHTTLTIGLSAIGVVFAYTVQNVNGESVIFYSALFTTVYLIASVLYLVSNCLIQGDFPPVYNEPKNLNQKNYSLDELKEFELQNMQLRIDEACVVIQKRSKALNNARKFLAVFPILSVIFWQSFKLLS